MRKINVPNSSSSRYQNKQQLCLVISKDFLKNLYPQIECSLLFLHKENERLYNLCHLTCHTPPQDFNLQLTVQKLRTQNHEI